MSLAGGVATRASIYEAVNGQAWSWNGDGRALSGEERSQAAGQAVVGVAAMGFGVRSATKNLRPPSLTPRVRGGREHYARPSARIAYPPANSQAVSFRIWTCEEMFSPVKSMNTTFRLQAEVYEP